MRPWCVSLLAVLLVFTAACGRSRGQASRAAAQPPLYQASRDARTIPAGTSLVLTVIPAVAPPLAEGAVLDAVVMRDVINESGDVIIGKGSPAELTVLPGGSLGLRAVMVHGNTYAVRSLSGDTGAAPLAGPREIAANSILPFRAGEAFVLHVPAGGK